MLLNLIILIIHGIEHTLRSSSLYSFLQLPPPVLSSPFGPNILLGTMFSNNLSSPKRRFEIVVYGTKSQKITLTGTMAKTAQKAELFEQ
jgi:hypothetical protein